MVIISPVGSAATTITANQLNCLATFKEKLCKSFCINSTVQPQATISYTKETAILVGSTVFVPIIATITITIPGCGCKAQTQIFTEKFVAAFQGRTALPTSVTITSVGTQKGGSCIKCGKAHGYTINDSLQITLA